MAVRIQVNLGEDMLKQVDQYADLMGVSRSALCSMLISNGIITYNEQIGLTSKIEKIEKQPRIYKRFKMAFDGWGSLFDILPNWRPEITIRDDYLCVEGQKVCPLDAIIEGIDIDHDCIEVLYTDKNGENDKKCFIYIDLPLNSLPVVEIEIEDNPTGTF